MGAARKNADIRSGDEILTVDGEPFHPVRSFRGKHGRQANVSVRRTKEGKLLTRQVDVERANALKTVDAASQASIRVIQSAGRRVAYVRFFSLFGFAAEQVMAAVPLDETDALVVDIRGLVGGGGPQLLEILDPRSGKICMRSRTSNFCQPSSFKGRAVLLTDGRTRSGAEILASAFRRNNFGRIVGTPTAGAVSGGRLFPLPNGGVVYVAVQQLTVDGINLEGVGMTPDMMVEAKLPYSAGADPQLDAAIRAAAAL